MILGKIIRLKYHNQLNITHSYLKKTKILLFLVNEISSKTLTFNCVIYPMFSFFPRACRHIILIPRTSNKRYTSGETIWGQ